MSFNLPPSPWLLALSGGADSVYLLHELRRRYPRAQLTAAHIDHGLRGADSDEDLRFCRQLCARLQVPLREARLDLDPKAGNLEARARRGRYRALARIARESGLHTLLTAHHADDALETFLMRWLRGTDWRGLTGFAANAPFPLEGAEGQGLRVVRPLLGRRAEDLRAELRARGLSWREDRSNESSRFTRNRVRHQLLPWLEEVGGPGALENLHRLQAAVSQSARAKLEGHPRLAWQANPLGAHSLDSGPLQKWKPDDLRSALHDLLHGTTGLRHPNASLLPIIQAIRAAEPGTWTLKGAWQLELHRRRLWLSSPCATPLEWSPRELSFEATGPQDLGGSLHLKVEWIDTSSSQLPPRTPWEVHLSARPDWRRLQVRRAAGHELFHPLGSPGRKPLRRFLSDSGIPRAWRPELPLIFIDDELVWVCGLRPAHPHRVRSDSGRRLRLALVRTSSPCPQ